MSLKVIGIDRNLISPEAFNQKLLAKAWFNANIIIWFTIFVYPLFTILDFIYAGTIWQVFFVLRVFVALVLYAFHEFAVKTRRPPYGIMHLGLVLMSLVQALECNLVGIDVLPVFFLLFTAIFISYNLIVFWKASNSFIHLLIALVFLSGFQILLSTHSANELVNNGGLFFFIIVAISCAIPQIRMVSQVKEISSQLELEKTNEELQIQRDHIEEQHSIIASQNNELQQINKQKTTLINIAGHDIKNLLGNILMPAEMLDNENDNFTPEQKELAGFIHQSANRMVYLLNHLLNLKEAQSSEIHFNLEMVNANHEVNAVVASLREKAAGKNITLEENLDQVPVSVRLDRVFSGQIFYNLLNNAIKFSQEGAVIEVRTLGRQDWFVYSILDNGPALGLQRMDGLFNKLKSLNDASLQDEDRQGLGLSIARLLTEGMGGKLNYDSGPGTGNRYEVRFPMA